MEVKTRFKDRDLFLLALQVLSRFMEGEEPASVILKRLAASLPAELRALPVDELATAVVRAQLQGKEAA